MPIDQTFRGIALEINASTDPAPETHPLLEYRFIDRASTQTILARIKGLPQPDGGGRLAFETNGGADTPTPRMLIDHHGNVGVGTENPRARLEVAGDGRFNGPLSVQDTLTASHLEVSGIAQIGGHLSVTGKLTAASFAGDGAELNNVIPAENSVFAAMLGVDAASLGKVSAEIMAANEGKIGIGTPNPRSTLEVTGDWIGERGALELSGRKPTIRFTGGSDLADLSWIIHLGGKGTGDLQFYKKSPSDSSWVFRMSLTESGIAKIPKLQLGNKWLLSGEGDGHSNDDWLRLFNTKSTDYFGGFAAGRLWSIGGTVQGSDLRLKTDVSSLGHMVDKLLALRAVRFKWRNAREDDSYRIGLIAQEVESVLPEVIETGPDGMKGINESGLVAAIVTAIKEQQAELRAQRAEIALLRAALLRIT